MKTVFKTAALLSLTGMALTGCSSGGDGVTSDSLAPGAVVETENADGRVVDSKNTEDSTDAKTDENTSKKTGGSDDPQDGSKKSQEQESETKKGSVQNGSEESDNSEKKQSLTKDEKSDKSTDEGKSEQKNEQKSKESGESEPSGKQKDDKKPSSKPSPSEEVEGAGDATAAVLGNPDVKDIKKFVESVKMDSSGAAIVSTNLSEKKDVKKHAVEVCETVSEIVRGEGDKPSVVKINSADAKLVASNSIKDGKIGDCSLLS